MLKQKPHPGVYTQTMRAVESLRSLPLSSLALLEVVFPRWGSVLGLLSSRALGWPSVELGQEDKSTAPSRRNGA